MARTKSTHMPCWCFIILAFGIGVICSYLTDNTNFNILAHVSEDASRSMTVNNTLAMNMISNITNISHLVEEEIPNIRSIEHNITEEVHHPNATNITATTSADLVQCDAYFRERFPRLHMRSFFHDLECLISSFKFTTTPLDECDNIRLIISDQQQNLLRSAYSQIFETKVIPHNEWAANNKSHYGCQRAKGYMSNKYGMMDKLQQYVIDKFGIRNKFNMSYGSKRFYEHYADILIIDRMHHRRISNVRELCAQINRIFDNRCIIAYFERLTLKQQWEHVLNASVVITPHGAAEASLIMARNRPVSVPVIELCPPYLHCRLRVDGHTSGYNYPLCPVFYKKRFFNRKIIGIAREHYLWNCSEYIKEKGSDVRFSLEAEFKKINHFEVDIGLVIQAISNATVHDVLISKVNM
eukprot:232863_1